MFADVLYDTSLIDVDSVIAHRFGSFSTGEVRDANGLVDEVGGLNIAEQQNADGSRIVPEGRQLVFSLSATAVRSGSVTVRTEAADSIQSRIHVHGDDADLSSRTRFGAGSLTIQPEAIPEPEPKPPTPSADTGLCRFDRDDNGVISFGDLVIFSQYMGRRTDAPDVRADIDFDGNGVVGFGDLALFAEVFGRVCEVQESGAAARYARLEPTPPFRGPAPTATQDVLQLVFPSCPELGSLNETGFARSSAGLSTDSSVDVPPVLTDGGSGGDAGLKTDTVCPDGQSDCIDAAHVIPIALDAPLDPLLTAES